MNRYCTISLMARTSGTPHPVALTMRFFYGAGLSTCDNVSHAVCTAQVPSKGVDVIAVVREAQEVEAVDQLCLMVRHAYVLVTRQWIVQVALIVQRLPYHMVER